MNTNYRKPLPGVLVEGEPVEFFDARQAVEDIQHGAYAKLPYTSRVLAEQLVRRCDPELLTLNLRLNLKSLIFNHFINLLGSIPVNALAQGYPLPD